MIQLHINIYSVVYGGIYIMTQDTCTQGTFPNRVACKRLSLKNGRNCIISLYAEC